MKLVPMDDALREAIAAAYDTRADAKAFRFAPTASIAALADFANRLQANFDRIKPLFLYGSQELQDAAVALFGSRAPDPVLGLAQDVQQAGAAVVGAIVSGPHAPHAAPAWTWDDTSGLYVRRNIPAAELAYMHVALDNLIAALSAVTGDA